MSIPDRFMGCNHGATRLLKRRTPPMNEPETKEHDQWIHIVDRSAVWGASRGIIRIVVRSISSLIFKLKLNLKNGYIFDGLTEVRIIPADCPYCRRKLGISPFNWRGGIITWSLCAWLAGSWMIDILWYESIPVPSRSGLRSYQGTAVWHTGTIVASASTVLQFYASFPPVCQLCLLCSLYSSFLKISSKTSWVPVKYRHRPVGFQLH